VEKKPILIVDDEEGIRSQLKWALTDSYTVLEAADGAEALALAREHKPVLVLQDISLSSREGATEGLELIEKYLDLNSFCKIIMVTGHGDKENALKAIQNGAYDFFSKPVDLEQLKVIINRAVWVAQLEEENSRLSSELAQRKSFEKIIGGSDKMMQVFEIIKTVSSNDYTILITGESGTGKELVARAIHNSGPRNDKPFMAINCGAIPENLLESELFGHEKGAFTDAHSRTKGKFEQANGGTIFLDEIGEMSLPLQVKLLRFLEDNRITRVGGSDEIPLKIRVLAASNRNLIEQVNKGSFREDLYYRISVITIEMPPLRGRGDDILLLANSFLNKYSLENNKPGLSFTEASCRAILLYHWPGNVRELENKVKRAVVMAPDKKIKPQDLALPADKKKIEEKKTLQTIREEAEKACLSESLARNNWNISKVSRELETSRTTLYDLIDKYKLRK
jgi:two-component system NtrC family response regulator